MGRKSRIIIISAPSGAGKSTLIQLLLTRIPSLFFSISHTTRPPRDAERDGVEYFFIDRQQFEEMIRNGEFLEWAQVHGHYYGTSRDMLRQAEAHEKDLLLDIDVQGAAQVRTALPNAISIFLLPPSFEALRVRILGRKTDTAEQVRQRVANAQKEIQRYNEYEYVVLNDELNAALEDLVRIIDSGSRNREISRESIEKILKSFCQGQI